MGNISQECSKQQYLRGLEMFAHLEKTFREGSPFKLWFNAEAQNQVAIPFRCVMRQELIGGPDNSTLNAAYKLDGRPRFSEDIKFLCIDVGKLSRLPLLNQKFYCRRRRVCGVIPTRKSCNDERAP